MARTYRLEHFAKGTGAAVVPNDEATEPGGEDLNTVALPATPRKPRHRASRETTALPAGHVRKKATGEIGRVQAIDSKSGTATVLWLRQGRTSTVALAALSRR